MSQPLPPSTVDWNHLFDLAAYIAVIAVVIVIGAMVFFAVKYREKKGQPKFIPEIGLSRARARETVIFASISIILLLSLSIASYQLTPNARFPPPVSQSLVINVTAFQWNFRFFYPNGVTTLGECFVPADKSIIFNVTSSDVMHNFGLMDFRVKIDAIPGRYNVVGVTTPPLRWKQPTKLHHPLLRTLRRRAHIHACITYSFGSNSFQSVAKQPDSNKRNNFRRLKR